MTRINLPTFIDHTNLKPEATPADIKRLCQDGIEYGFCTVCVNPCYVKLAAQELKSSELKVKEAELACRDGAQEIDMVINVGALKSGDYKYIEEEIKSILKGMGKGKVLKVILETSVLTEKEKIKGATIVKESGAHFVKTSTGWGPGGATVEDVALLRKTVGKDFGVKASGLIRDYQKTFELIQAGANRIGTSASLKIMEEYLRA